MSAEKELVISPGWTVIVGSFLLLVGAMFLIAFCCPVLSSMADRIVSETRVIEAESIAQSNKLIAESLKGNEIVLEYRKIELCKERY